MQTLITEGISDGDMHNKAHSQPYWHACQAAGVGLHAIVAHQRCGGALQRACLPLPQRVAHLHGPACTMSHSGRDKGPICKTASNPAAF